METKQKRGLGSRDDLGGGSVKCDIGLLDLATWLRLETWAGGEQGLRPKSQGSKPTGGQGRGVDDEDPVLSFGRDSGPLVPTMGHSLDPVLRRQ